MSDFSSPLTIPLVSTFSTHSYSASLAPMAARITGLSFSSATAWPAANRAIFAPVITQSPITAYKIAWVNGAAVSGNIDVGIYDVNGNRIVSAGTTVQAGTSNLQVADIVDTALSPGVYFLAVALDNTTGTISGAAADPQLCTALGVQQMASAFVLPATATFANPASPLVPLISVVTSRFAVI